MLKKYQKFRLPDEANQNHIVGEVNWNPEDEKTNDCKVIKLTLPDGNNTFLKKEYLNTLLFAIGTSEEQQKMIPQRIVRTRHYKTMLGITAKKDIRKGEKINFEVDIPMPDVEEEIIGQLKKKVENKTSKGIIIPK